MRNVYIGKRGVPGEIDVYVGSDFENPINDKLEKLGLVQSHVFFGDKRSRSNLNEFYKFLTPKGWDFLAERQNLLNVHQSKRLLTYIDNLKRIAAQRISKAKQSVKKYKEIQSDHQKKKLASIQKLAAESLEIVEIAGEVSQGVFTLKRLAEMLSQCNLRDLNLSGISNSQTNMTKNIPKLLREEASTLESISKTLLKEANKELEPLAEDVLLDSAQLLLENIQFSCGRQLEYGRRVCEKIESITSSLPTENIEDYDMDVEEGIAAIDMLVFALERFLSSEKASLEASKSLLEKAQKDSNLINSL